MMEDATSGALALSCSRSLCLLLLRTTTSNMIQCLFGETPFIGKDRQTTKHNIIVCFDTKRCIRADPIRPIEEK